MKTYFDSSVFLRVLLNNNGKIDITDFAKEGLITSELTRIESHRVIYRDQYQRKLSAPQIQTLLTHCQEMLEGMTLIRLNRAVWARAADPMPAPVRTLDALHIAAALYWQQSKDEEILFITHDAQQANAAKLMGLQTRHIP